MRIATNGVRTLVGGILLVLGTLLVATAFTYESQEVVDYAPAIIIPESESEHVGRPVIACRSLAQIEELAAMSFGREYQQVTRRLLQMERGYMDRHASDCQIYYLEGTEEFRVIKEYPLAEITPMQLGFVAIVLMRQTDGTELYVELTHHIGEGHGI